MVQPDKLPKVSVCVITYNQEQYIRQCLQSIVDQKTDFPFEVIVGDDCSTDNTRLIVQEFVQRHPGVVRTIFQKTNTGGSRNNIDVHSAALGEYVAHVDGDDYLLPGKLQVQADYLDNHKECNIVWHRMYALSSCGEMYEDNFAEIGMTGRQYFICDLISNITVGLHSSKMYRKNAANISEMREEDLIDFAINIYQIQPKGSYGAFVSDTPYGVYRLNMGLSTRTASVRKMIYRWLLQASEERLADKSIVNAKVIWMLLSDFRHSSGSILTGLHILFKTIRSINIKAIFKVRSRMFPSSIKFRKVPN